MRLVEGLVSKDKREPITEILDDEDIDFVLTEEASDRDLSAVISFPLPALAVEPVLSRLREIRTEDDFYTILMKAETVVSKEADTEIQSTFNRPGIGPLIGSNRAEIEVQYVLQES